MRNLKDFLDWLSTWRFARKLLKWTRLTDHLIREDSWQLVYMPAHLNIYVREHPGIWLNPRTLMWVDTEVPPEGTEVVNVGP